MAALHHLAVIDSAVETGMRACIETGAEAVPVDIGMVRAAIHAEDPGGLFGRKVCR